MPRTKREVHDASLPVGYVRPMGVLDAEVIAHMQPQLAAMRCDVCHKRLFPLEIAGKPEAVTLEDFCSCEDGPAHHLLANAVLDEDEASLRKVIAEQETKQEKCARLFGHSPVIDEDGNGWTCAQGCGMTWPARVGRAS